MDLRYEKFSLAHFSLWEEYLLKNHRVMAFVYSYATGVAKMPYYLSHRERYGFGWYSIFENSEFVGRVGLFWNNSSPAQVELGYTLREEYWGRGIATIASRFVIDEFFGLNIADEIVATIEDENIGSVQVAKKLGFVSSGNAEVFIEGNSRPLKLYRLAKKDSKMITTSGLIADKNGTLHLHQEQLPALSEHEVVIKTAFAGVNRADLGQAKGSYPPPPGVTEILGLECSGEIVVVGSSVTELKIGDKVMALVSGGAFATHVIAEAATTFKVPPHLSLQEAAVIPESLFTFWENTYIAGGLRAGMVFLVHGGASGLGSFSITMAKNIGCRVYSTARGKERAAFVKSLGADLVIDTEGLNNEEIANQLLSIIGENNVDVIMDHLGGAFLTPHCALLKKKGRMVLINSAVGSIATLDLGLLIGKRLHLIGSVLRSRPSVEKQEIAASIREHALPLLSGKGFKVAVDQVYSLSEAPNAFTRVEQRLNRGKVLLQTYKNYLQSSN